MVDSDEFKAELVENLSHLRAFAHLIARNHALAEDLVQDTIVRALANRHQFKPGTNLKGWLIIILRNRFFNEMRRSSRKAEVSVEHLDNLVAIDGGQQVTVEIRDFNRAFRQLPPTQREALVLVGASGFSYEEAAEIAHCPVGTMKSRVSRARAELDDQLRGVERPERWADRTAIEDEASQDEASQEEAHEWRLLRRAGR
ncbi:RNA polymerase sigma factor [Aliidongia dinghuensis]|uniref:RNA polymerase sigma factor n=1 Tax=Aliidongia dinghuensis TaxID=1867774 RepID=A0A8J2YY22_9PROT|nr:sigma-70 family RNA polymerase sigma factor [Aliidongia dinghuensis]GGF34758.1 RNA polymerase sigma factor [Aliidongia dinghuensis]